MLFSRESGAVGPRSSEDRTRLTDSRNRPLNKGGEGVRSLGPKENPAYRFAQLVTGNRVGRLRPLSMKTKSLCCFYLMMISHLSAGEIKEVVRAAYSRSWEIQNAKSTEINTADAYRNKSLFFLPSVSAGAGIGYEGSTATGPAHKHSDYYIEAKSVLLSMGQWDDKKIAAADKEVQNLKLEEEKNNFCLKVANLYFVFLVEKRKADDSAQVIETLSKQFKTTTSEYRQGLKPRRDYLRLRTEMGTLELELQNQKLALKESRDKLRDKVGDSFEGFKFDPGSLEPPEQNTESPSKDSSKEQHSILTESKNKELDMLRFTRQKSKHELWPKVTLSGKYRIGDENYWGENKFSPGADDRYWNVMLGLEYTLFDWGKTSRDKEIEIRKSIIRENEVHQEIRDSDNNHSLVVEKLKLAGGIYKARSSLLENEKESFRLLSRDYREGKITFIDYITSLRSLSHAELSLFEGLVELNRAYFELLRHKGTLDEYFNL